MRKYFLSLCLLLTGLSYAQDKPAEDNTDEIVFDYLNRPSLDLEYNLGLASPHWSTNQMFGLISGGFIDDATKNELYADAADGLRLGVEQGFEFRFVYKGHKQRKLLPLDKNSLVIFHRNYFAADLSGDLMKLGLFGNAPSAGELQTIGPSYYQSWNYSGLGFQFSFFIDTIPVSAGLSFVGVHTLEDYRINSGTLLSASNGSQIDFTGNYDFRFPDESNLSLDGIGLATEWRSVERFGKHYLSLDIKDLGFAYFQGLNAIQRDSAFSFRGLSAPDIFNIRDSLLSLQGDSLRGGLGGNELTNTWRLLPFRLSLDYRYRFNQGHYVFGSFNYLYLPSYIPRFDAGYGHESRTDFSYQLGFGYGGFNGFSISGGFNWRINRYWTARAHLSNILGATAPGLAGGSQVRLGVHYSF